MTIYVERPKSRYAAIPNAIIQNAGLSHSARFLWVYLASLPRDFDVRAKTLQAALGVGRDRMQAMCRELSDAGFLRREPRRGAGGTVSGWNWYLIDDPATVCLKNRPTVQPSPVNQAPYKDTPNKNPPPPSGASPPEGADTPPKRRRGVRISEDWRPSEKVSAWLRREGYDADHAAAQVEIFRDHWLAESGQRARKVDWDAAFRSWMGKEPKGPQAKGRKHGRGRKTGDERDQDIAAIAARAAGK